MQTTDEMSTYLMMRGIDNKVQSDEVKVHVCLFCGNDRWNLELNPAIGVYHCWACNSSGTLRTFMAEHFNLTVHIPVNYEAAKTPIEPDHYDVETVGVSEVPSAMHYLSRRNITLVEAMQYQLRLGIGKDAMHHRILFPVREYFSQSMHGYIGRSFTNLVPKYMLSFKTPVVAGYRHFISSIHILVEGTIDGIAIHRAGYNAAVLLGASHDAILDSWAARVPKDHSIIILMDGEARDRSEKIKWRLEPIHPNVDNFFLPEHMDPGDLEPTSVRALVTTVLERSVNQCE